MRGSGSGVGQGSDGDNASRRKDWRGRADREIGHVGTFIYDHMVESNQGVVNIRLGLVNGYLTMALPSHLRSSSLYPMSPYPLNLKVLLALRSSISRSRYIKSGRNLPVAGSGGHWGWGELLSRTSGCVTDIPHSTQLGHITVKREGETQKALRHHSAPRVKRHELRGTPSTRMFVFGGERRLGASVPPRSHWQGQRIRVCASIVGHRWTVMMHQREGD